MPASLGFWRTTLRFDKAKIHPWIGLRNAAGVVLPLIVSMALGSAASGLAMATGALNVSYSDSDAPFPHRLRNMLAASLVVGLSVSAGAWAGQYGPAGVALICAWAFACGMLVCLSPAVADMGLISLATTVIWAVTPLDGKHAGLAGLLAFGGGLVQTLAALAPWPLERYAPERRALSEFYLEIARSITAAAQVTLAPPATLQSTQAQQFLASLIEDHSVDAERYRLLLSEAERMRLAVLLIARLRGRLEREGNAAAERALVDRGLLTASRAIGAIGEALAEANRDTSAIGESRRELDRLADEVRACKQPPMVEIRRPMDALAGQYRAAADLLEATSPATREKAARQESEISYRLHFTGARATLKANLNFRSSAFRHAVRLAVCVGLGDVLARGFHLSRSYWLPMTIAIVLKPDFTATFSRGVLRLAGTFLGLAAATLLFHLVPGNLMAIQVALLAVFVFVLRGYGSANYGIFVLAITAVVVQMFSISGVAPAEVMGARALNTALGGLLALTAYALWPTWERTQVKERLAQLLDAYRLYFRKIRERYEHPEQIPPSEMEKVRVEGRLARSNLEASLDRLTGEPGTEETTLRSLSAVLAGTHRMVHSMMALEASLDAGGVAVAEPFSTFANHVELELYLLAAALRGSRVDAGSLPDLREDHRQMVQGARVDALLATETDRITNSVNTVAVELFFWLGNGIQS